MRLRARIVEDVANEQPPGSAARVGDMHRSSHGGADHERSVAWPPQPCGAGMRRRPRPQPTSSRSASSMSARSATSAGPTSTTSAPQGARSRRSATRSRRTYRRKRAGRPRRRARRSSNWRATGNEADLHHLVRLHGPDRQGRQAIIPTSISSTPPATSATTNLATYTGRFYEGRYVQGMIAGKMSKSGIVGYVGSFPIPEVVSGINAFMLGAQSVKPNIKIKIIWVNELVRPGQGSRRRQGADRPGRRHHHAAHRQPGRRSDRRAARRPRLRPGLRHDQVRPDAQLTAIVDNWAPYYIERTQAVLDGTWKSGDTWGGLGTKMVVMAPFTNMPDDVKTMAEATRGDHRPASSTPSMARFSSRTATRREGGRRAARPRHPRHELVRQGDRREGAGLIPHKPGSKARISFG